MPTITIDNAAGNFDFNVQDISFKDLFKEAYTSFSYKSAKGVQTATLSQKDGDYVSLIGELSFSGLENHNRSKAIDTLDTLAVGRGKKEFYSIEDLNLTGKIIQSDSALAAWMDKQSFTIEGNNFANELAGGNKNDKLYGNGGKDSLYGGYGDDKLYGGAGDDLLDGGKGKNVLDGGDGNDTYVLGASDKIVEGSGKNSGFDTIIASTNIDLSKFNNVEAAHVDGKGNFKLLGNALNNVLEGNDGKNLLDGGKGADRLVGGNGDDTYVVDNAKDVVVETGKKDHDTIEATVSVDLSKLKLVEDVFLFGKQDLNATGNSLNNVLKGNDGDNTLWGAGGNDTLTGGKGTDTFEFHKGDKFDTITDFDASGKDHDLLDLQGFGKKFNFNSITIEKVGKSDVEISFGHGDTLHIHLVGSAIKDIDASDFQF